MAYKRLGGGLYAGGGDPGGPGGCPPLADSVTPAVTGVLVANAETTAAASEKRVVDNISVVRCFHAVV